MSRIVLSVVVPVYNEAANIRSMYASLESVLPPAVQQNYEIIYVDDGSTDGTPAEIAKLRRRNNKVKLLSLSRNFGKEVALAAGISQASGKAIVTLDGDGQHPVERIPDFLDAWREGAQVVIGVRTANRNEGAIKKYGSKLFYALFNRLSGMKMVPGSSDFRLIDQEVQKNFVQLEEPNSITRGLIDWLGFHKQYIYYEARPRTAEAAGYKFHKLVKLAANSFVSLSPKPLYAFGYLGLGITGISLLLGLSILIQQLLLGDPLSWEFTGTAMLSVLVLFLVGLVLVSQGVLALYISAIHAQSKHRPLYIINKKSSLGITEKSVR